MHLHPTNIIGGSDLALFAIFQLGHIGDDFYKFNSKKKADFATHDKGFIFINLRDLKNVKFENTFLLPQRALANRKFVEHFFLSPKLAQWFLTSTKETNKKCLHI